MILQLGMAVVGCDCRTCVAWCFDGGEAPIVDMNLFLLYTFSISPLECFVTYPIGSTLIVVYESNKLNFLLGSG